MGVFCVGLRAAAGGEGVGRRATSEDAGSRPATETPPAVPVGNREWQPALIDVDPADAPALKRPAAPNSALGHRQLINVAEDHAVPPVEVANRAVQRGIYVAKVEEIGPALARLGRVQFVGALRSADVIDLLRPGIACLEI